MLKSSKKSLRSRPKYGPGFGILRTWSEDQCVDCGLAGSPVAWLFGISDAEDVPPCRKKM